MFRFRGFGSFFFITLASALVLQAAETLRFTVVGIDCESCAAPILKALKSVTGVANPKLDWKTAVATVEVPDGFDREKVRKALQEIGYEAVFEGETRRPDLSPLPEEVRRTLDIQSASEGEKIDIARVLVPGKVTVLDYWAEWCSPCHLLDARLQHLVQANADVAVRRINIGKWDNAAAKQATLEFRVEALPYVRVYDGRGKLAGAVTGGSWDKIVPLIKKAQEKGGGSR
jgi:thiol-disulfide isomerase/thioredoxin